MRLNSYRAALLACALCIPAQIGVSTPAAAWDSPASFADLAHQLLPAVVNISSSQTVQGAAEHDGPEMPALPPGSPFEQYFHDFMDKRHAQPNAPGGQEQTPRKAQSLGSGFIVDASGIVVTNNHVISGADEVTVTLQDNTTLKAEVVGKDDRTDLAVLRVHTDRKLPALTFGDSDKMRVGDWVLAIGNPFGLGGTVTSGIVSARGRDIRQGPYDDFLQTDAPINRGNSGGPLFNMKGEVIGVNTAIYSPSGGSIGIGFAIPASMARNVVAQIRDFGHAKRGWLGVRIQQMTPDIAESLALKDSDGALVAGVNEGGPAEKAQLHNGDVIRTFNGQDVKEMRSLPRIVAETPIGQQVPVVVWRDGKAQTVQVAIAEMPDDQPKPDAMAHPDKPKPAQPQGMMVAGTGLSVAAMNDELRAKYQIAADQKGVVIIAADGPSSQRGLKPGDLILQVQQDAIASPDDLQQRIEKLRRQSRKSVLLLVQGADGLRWTTVAFDQPAKK